MKPRNLLYSGSLVVLALMWGCSSPSTARESTGYIDSVALQLTVRLDSIESNLEKVNADNAALAQELEAIRDSLAKSPIGKKPQPKTVTQSMKGLPIRDK
jgi:hypothetical protein